jgi:putative phosphoribosyl transferase
VGNPNEHIDVAIESAGVELSANLGLPAAPRGLVLFAHSCSAGRFSSRSRYLAGVVEEAGFATLLVDLLTDAEDLEDALTGRLRADVRLLADRLADATEWAARACFGSLPLGYVGAGSGAAAALVADARSPGRVQAVVCRGGRPDLARDVLRDVRAPTLLLAGSADAAALRHCREALAGLHCPTALRVIPGATQLFEEPGVLAAVGDEASGWFRQHLRVNPAVPARAGR